MTDTPTLTVYSDGCRLCQDALTRLRTAAEGSGQQVREQPLAKADAETIEALGIRATPAVAFEHGLLSVGCPSAEEARLLVQRAEIDRRILSHAIPQSDAVQRFASGRTDGDATARALAGEFYAFCNEFPLFLAAAISHVRDEKARLLLVSNLYEEHGDLQLDRMHPALFRKFMRGLGLEAAKLQTYHEGDPGLEAARLVTQLCREGPAHRALATLYAIELLFAPCCDMIVRGLKHLHLAPETIYFWELHSGADVEHAEQLRTALFTACTTSEQWRDAVALASDVSLMFYELFDFITRAAFSTTRGELAVYEAVKTLCAESPSVGKYPVEYKDAAYYFGINAGAPDRWFLRAFCDTDRHSLVTRFPVGRAKLLAPGFEVTAAPDVFGRSRVYFKSTKDLERLRTLVVDAYELEVKRIETGTVDDVEAHW